MISVIWIAVPESIAIPELNEIAEFVLRHPLTGKDLVQLLSINLAQFKMNLFCHTRFFVLFVDHVL